MSHLIRVWRIRLDVDDAVHARLRTCLDEHENRQAAQFRMAVHRRRYEVCHGAVRHVLGGLINSTPNAVELSRTPAGKPFLSTAPTSLHFNLSHSGDLALLATSTLGEVGVDVEYVQPLADWVLLAAQVCTVAERAVIAAQPDPVLAFYRGWTGKEAVLKCLGLGVATARLSDWPVLDRDGVLRSCVGGTADANPRRVALRAVDPLLSGYVAAVAVCAPDLEVETGFDIQLQDWAMRG